MRLRRSRLLLGAALVASVAVPFAARADNPVTPADGGTVAAQCYANASTSTDDGGYKLCRSVAAAEAAAAAQCRMPLRSAPDATLPEYCGVFDGREVSAAKIAAYQTSWTHRALALQRRYDASAPLFEEQLGHTHNSFNASAYTLPDGPTPPDYYATLTNQDPNQVYSITDQLRMDIRVVEIDLHWVPSVYGTPATGGYWVTACHGDGQDLPGGAGRVHVGCSDDRPASSAFAEVQRWLHANPHEFVMVYLENQLDGSPQGHALAVQQLRDAFGPMLATPPAGLPSGTCANLPYDESRAQFLGRGQRVALVGNCGPGAWNQVVFSRGAAWDESGKASTYGAAACAADQKARENSTSFRRFYDESPWLEAMTGGTDYTTPAIVARMVRCGVNIIGFDQLEPDDGRLAALVWSWAPGEPSSNAPGRCAYQGADGRFHAGYCTAKRLAACRNAAGDWHVTRKAVRFSDAARECSKELAGARFGVPANGYRNAQLAGAKPTSATQVWVDDTSAAWSRAS